MAHFPNDYYTREVKCCAASGDAVGGSCDDTLKCKANASFAFHAKICQILPPFGIRLEMENDPGMSVTAADKDMEQRQ